MQYIQRQVEHPSLSTVFARKDTHGGRFMSNQLADEFISRDTRGFSAPGHQVPKHVLKSLAAVRSEYTTRRRPTNLAARAQSVVENAKIDKNTRVFTDPKTA